MWAVFQTSLGSLSWWALYDRSCLRSFYMKPSKTGEFFVNFKVILSMELRWHFSMFTIDWVSLELNVVNDPIFQPRTGWFSRFMFVSKWVYFVGSSNLLGESSDQSGPILSLHWHWDLWSATVWSPEGVCGESPRRIRLWVWWRGRSLEVPVINLIFFSHISFRIERPVLIKGTFLFEPL